MLISPRLAKRLGHSGDSSLVDRTAALSFVEFSFKGFDPMSFLSGNLPFQEKQTEYTIIGVCEVSGFGRSLRNAVYIPLSQAEQLESSAFQDFEEVLWKVKGGKQVFLSANVLVERMELLDSVRERLEDMGFGTYSLLDEMEEFKKFFLIFKAVLGGIGGIALFVGCLGIANTMLMSVLERKREIGVFKAVGARDAHVKGLFFYEAGIIGFAGGILGLLLGYSVAQVVEGIMNHYMKRAGMPPEALSLFPWWLIGGAVVFAIGVSLAAGVYPAVRAARVDPVKALHAE